MYFFHFISVLYIFLFVKTALVYNSLSPLWFSSMISWHMFVHFTSMFIIETPNWKTHFSFKVTCANWSFSLHFSVLWSILIQINQTDLIYIFQQKQTVLDQNKSPDKQLNLCFCEVLWVGYEILPFSWWHSFARQMQLSFPFCLFLLSPSFRLILISCFELHPAFSHQPPQPPSHKYEGISVIYSPQGLPVILTTPLWMPRWHPNSTERRSRPPPAPP